MSRDMDLVPTRRILHRVAAHVLGRARHRATGRFGLRVSPGGFATPAYGDGSEVLRVAAGALVRETADGAAYTTIDGTSLRELAAFAGVTLDEDFSVGTETPPLGDVDRPLVLDPAAAELLASWLGWSQLVLDRVCAAFPATARPAVLQLWPEHFDLGTSLTLPGDDHVNLGSSLGDDFSEDPYLYVGPWDDVRPGDPGYWDAPFGAVRRLGELQGAKESAAAEAPSWPDPGSFDAGLAFFDTGLALLGLQPRSTAIADPERR